MVNLYQSLPGRNCAIIALRNIYANLEGGKSNLCFSLWGDEISICSFYQSIVRNHIFMHGYKFSVWCLTGIDNPFWQVPKGVSAPLEQSMFFC